MQNLPQIDFFGTPVSRLIIGGNPFSGNSHWSPEKSEEMLDYYTNARIKETLAYALENGINTCQLRGDRHISRMLREFRAEGHAINWIAQTASEIVPYENHVKSLKANGAFAIYHHGTKTDSLYQAGKIDELQARLRVIRESGAVTGLCSHIPEVLEYAEMHHWDVDFYMCCVYNISKKDEPGYIPAPGRKATEEPFDESDRKRMFDFIRSTQKPCLAFKILGAGRRCTSPEDVRAAFTETYTSIKPTDAAVVGFFPKNRDEIAENTALVRSLLG